MENKTKHQRAYAKRREAGELKRSYWATQEDHVKIKAFVEALKSESSVANEVYFDTETTGLDDSAEIIQVGIIDNQGNVLMNTLVQCQGDIPKQASDIHGIKKSDLRNAPTWPEIHSQVCKILSGAKMVNIYNASYDVKLLRQTSARHGLDVPVINTHCVMRDYTDKKGLSKWQKLTVACDMEGIKTDHLNAHDAVSDCEMTRLLNLAIRG